jgi:hypothetical protein
MAVTTCLGKCSLSNGLVSTVPAAIQSGQAAELTIKLSNASPQTIYFGRIDGLRELNIRVTNSNKIAPELTPLGKKAHAFASSRFASYRNTPLEPGQSHEWHADLNTLYKLEPGTYFVSGSIDVNHIVNVNPFTISVEGMEFAIH